MSQYSLPVPTGDQRDPFVRGCVPANTDPNHDTGRVKAVMTGLCQGAVSDQFHGWFMPVSSRSMTSASFTQYDYMSA